MLDDATLEHGRRVFEDVLRTTALSYTPTTPLVVAGKMQGPDGPVICGYWRVLTDGTFERLTVDGTDTTVDESRLTGSADSGEATQE